MDPDPLFPAGRDVAYLWDGRQQIVRPEFNRTFALERGIDQWMRVERGLTHLRRNSGHVLQHAEAVEAPTPNTIHGTRHEQPKIAAAVDADL